MKTLKSKVLVLLTVCLYILSACEDASQVFSPNPASTAGSTNNKNTNSNNVEEAITFLNTHFTSATAGRATYVTTTSTAGAKHSDPNKRLPASFEEDTTYVLNGVNDKPLFKLICFKQGGYALVSNLAQVPNPPVLFYSTEKFDRRHVNPGLIGYIEEFVLTHTNRLGRPPTDGEDGDGDGAWDDGRDTQGSSDPRDSPYYHKVTVISSWSETTQKGPLLSTYWAQGDPYNRSCPIIEGRHALVGCVAVALGQVINYHRKNTLKSYNWNVINNKASLYAGADDLPDFLHDIGEGVQMNYGIESSGATNAHASSYLSSAGYASSIVSYDYERFKQSIDANKPLYISGYAGRKPIKIFGIIWNWSYQDGHAWVGDGYKTVKNIQKRKVDNGNKGGGVHYTTVTTSVIKYIHMNWGWGEFNNSQQQDGGWCTYNYFKAVNYNFQYQKMMIVY